MFSGHYTSYEGWSDLGDEFLDTVNDEEIASLFTAARDGNEDAKRALANLAFGNIGVQMRERNAREEKAWRGFWLLFWLKSQTH